MRKWFESRPEWRAALATIPDLLDVLKLDPGAQDLRALTAGIWEDMGETATLMEGGNPFVWFNLGFNPELILGLKDVGRICIESQAVIQNIVGNPDYTLEFIDLAESKGVPSDCCSADKAAVGAIMRDLYPQPACVVGINTPCDSQVMSTQAMAELSGKPFFVIDVPYYDDDRTVRHVAAQLRELIPFLEKHTGRKLDWDRLRRVCELSNRAVEKIWEWLDWRRQVPLCQSSKLVAFTLVHQIAFVGTERGVMIAEALAREARKKFESNERFFEEKVRAVWYQDPVWTDLQIYDWMERELGLTVPVDVFGFYANEGLIDTSSEESMLYGLGRKLAKCQPMSRQFRGNIETYIADFMHMHEAFRADCGIFAGHLACKHSWGGIGLFREACRKADIPLLVFEFDMFDSRVTSREAIEAELTRFVNEVVLPKKRRFMQKSAKSQGAPGEVAADTSREDTMIDFLKRLESIGGVLQAVAGKQMQAVFEFRPSGRRVQLDFASQPLRVTVGGPGLDGVTGLAGTTGDLHEAFIGRLSMMEGMGQRRLLAKGGMWYQSKFFLILILIPVLYAEHLYSAGARRPGAVRRALAALFGFFFGISAFIGGFLARSFCEKEMILALGAISFGMGCFSPRASLPKVPKVKGKYPGHPLAPRRPGFLRICWLALVLLHMYLTGWFLSVFRYKLRLPIDPFIMLDKVARGLGRTAD